MVAHPDTEHPAVVPELHGLRGWRSLEHMPMFAKVRTAMTPLLRHGTGAPCRTRLCLQNFDQMFCHPMVCFTDVPQHSAARAHAVNKWQGASDTHWTADLQPELAAEPTRKQIAGVSPDFLNIRFPSIVSIADRQVHVLCACR